MHKQNILVHYCSWRNSRQTIRQKRRNTTLNGGAWEAPKQLILSALVSPADGPRILVEFISSENCSDTRSQRHGGRKSRLHNVLVLVEHFVRTKGGNTFRAIIRQATFHNDDLDGRLASMIDMCKGTIVTEGSKCYRAVT